METVALKSNREKEAMSRGNATQGGYRSNPYFDGVISAITTQGEVTANVRADRWEIEERRKNSSSVRQTGSYPGGELFDNLHVYPHELVFGWTNKKARFNFPGEPNEIGFSSLNGIWFEQYDTDEEMMDNMYLIGLAKTPFKFDDLSQLKHGFSAIRVGSGSTFHTGTRPFYSGDLVGWEVIPRPQAIDVNMPVAFSGGEYGGNSDPRFGSAYNKGGRQGYPRAGTPRGKFRFIVNPVVRGDIKPGMNGVISKMMKPMSQGGVSNMPVEAILPGTRNKKIAGTKRPTPYQEYALGTLVTDVVGAMRVTEVMLDAQQLFHRNDVIDLVTQIRAAAVGAGGGAGAVGAAVDAIVGPGLPPGPSRRRRVLDLIDQTGIFNQRERLTPLAQSIVDALYIGYSANAATSIRETARLRNNFTRAFGLRGQISDNITTEVRYVKIVTSYANVRQGSYDRAVHHKTRRIIGTALGPSNKGQRLDILLGHFRI